MIRLSIPSIGEDDLQVVREVIASGYLVQGERVAAFEQAVAAYVGTQYAIAVSNCTAALHLALLALDVRSGDLVLVTSYSWIATANVIELCGAQPIFVDIHPDTFNMDPDCLAETLEHLMSNNRIGKHVKAIIPVHTFGQMADMSSINDIAEQYNLPVIEDGACALGAKYKNRTSGTWGLMGCFSFHPRKAITTGEGGMIVTNDLVLARKLRALRNHGQDPDAPTTEFIMPGFNYRMTEFQAALGLTQLSKLDRIIKSRCKSAGYYDILLAGSQMQPPIVSEGNQHIFQSYVVLLPIFLSQKRQNLIQALKNDGIEITIGTCHMPLTNYFRTRYGYKQGDFPVTDDVYERALTLPLFENISTEQLDIVIHKLEDAIRSI
jgi:perosamine synthetase